MRAAAEPVPAWLADRRAQHRAFTERVFYHQQTPFAVSPMRGQAPGYPADAALWWGDENEAVPDRCLPVLPEPEIRDGMIWGASATMKPRPPMDPNLAWGSREEPARSRRTRSRSARRRARSRRHVAAWLDSAPVRRGAEPADAVAVDVAAWLEGVGEPMTAWDLVELTGHEDGAVVRALGDWRFAGRVAKQLTRDETLWVWRRAP